MQTCVTMPSLRLVPALLLIVVFTISAFSLVGGSVLYFAVDLGSAYGVNASSLGASLLLVGLVGFLLFVVLLGAWAFRRGGSRNTVVDHGIR